VIYFVLKATP